MRTLVRLALPLGLLLLVGPAELPAVFRWPHGVEDARWRQDGGFVLAHWQGAVRWSASLAETKRWSWPPPDNGDIVLAPGERLVWADALQSWTGQGLIRLENDAVEDTAWLRWRDGDRFLYGLLEYSARTGQVVRRTELAAHWCAPQLPLATPLPDGGTLLVCGPDGMIRYPSAEPVVVYKPDRVAIVRPPSPQPKRVELPDPDLGWLAPDGLLVVPVKGGYALVDLDAGTAVTRPVAEPPYDDGEGSYQGPDRMVLRLDAEGAVRWVRFSDESSLFDACVVGSTAWMTGDTQLIGFELATGEPAPPLPLAPGTSAMHCLDGSIGLVRSLDHRAGELEVSIVDPRVGLFRRARVRDAAEVLLMRADGALLVLGKSAPEIRLARMPWPATLEASGEQRLLVVRGRDGATAWSTPVDGTEPTFVLPTADGESALLVQETCADDCGWSGSSGGTDRPSRCRAWPRTCPSRPSPCSRASATATPATPG